MAKKVSRYYDLNTPRFLRFGHGKNQGAIHRAVWAGGSSSREDAMDYVNTLIAGFIRDTGASRIMDIGCGIGGSMVSLAKKTGADFTGITISMVQVETGKAFIGKNGFSDRCRIFEGDFCATSVRGIPGSPFDLLFALESFLHMEDSRGFFAASAELLGPEGELVLCDDFLNREIVPGEKHSRQISKLIRRYKLGWQVETLITPDSAVAQAESQGFRCLSRQDLSPYLELNRTRDLLIRTIVPLINLLRLSSPFWQNMTGGDALQRLLGRRDLGYHLLRFKKSRSPETF